MYRGALPDLEAATRLEVERAIRRRLLTLRPGADLLEAVMGVVGPVMDAKDAALAKSRSSDSAP